mgnify:CR=1 FL=1
MKFLGKLLLNSKKVQEVNTYSTFGILETVYNILYRGIERNIIKYCKSENIDIVSYSPLGAGFITGKYKNGLLSPKETRFDIKPAHKDIYFKEFLEYVDMTEQEFFSVCDRFRAEHLWEMKGNQWVLKKPVWQD